MKKLTAENVESVFLDCFFRDGEDTSDPVIAQIVTGTFGFHRGRIEEHKFEIKELLDGLPDEFKSDNGGGGSFLNACMTRDGEHWGEHRNVEQLMALGIASGQARFLVPPLMWRLLPGGTPYFVIV